MIVVREFSGLWDVFQFGSRGISFSSGKAMIEEVIQRVRGCIQVCSILFVVQKKWSVVNRVGRV